jgi:NAD+ synthetase
LSGGVDSALVAAIAVDALGPKRVRAVMMPFRYTSNMSQEDAAKQAALLGIRYDVIPIAPMFDATVGQLEEIFEGREEDVTEENIQARCRGLLLMSISNKTGRMLLTTGNKSEMAVGYATLYGDMAGGFAPIKDCSKTLVYRLAEYRNTRGQVIPASRPPSFDRTRKTRTRCPSTTSSTRSSPASSRRTCPSTRSSTRASTAPWSSASSSS